MSVFDVDNSNVINAISLIEGGWIKESGEGEWMKSFKIDLETDVWTYGHFEFNVNTNEIYCDFTLRRKIISSMKDIDKFISRQIANTIRAYERRNSK